LLLYDIYKKGAGTSAYKKAEITAKVLSYYAHRYLCLEDVLPWDHIDLGLNKEYFISEYNRAIEGKITARCTDENAKYAKFVRHK
jgi:hypothetical protein